MPTMYCIVTIKLEKDNVMKKTLRKHIYWIYWGGKKSAQKWTRAVQLYYELNENENTTHENCGTPLNST